MSVPETAYDRVPYRSFPFPQTHPDRLATIGTLLGLNPQPVDGCRVLELGCAAGGNLLPMAAQFPNSRFLGIDASQRQIADGRAAVAQVGLQNLELRYQDILDFPADAGEFDYIISHGVYSWIPGPVQTRMLDICSRHLAPQGIAYISYNTYPGWHMRAMIRDIMRYRASSFEHHDMQLAQARTLLSFLEQSVPTKDNPYGMLLKQEVDAIARSADYYLIHEHLEDINQPLYFHQFAERAEAAGLQYLGEADFGAMNLDNFPVHVRAMLRSVSRNLIETEQYMDFLRNRAFRQTLLCRADAAVDRSPTPERLMALRVASSATPAEPGPVDIRSDRKVEFRRKAARLGTTNPVIKAALVRLRDVWPASIPVPELASSALAIASGRPVVTNTDILTPQSRNLVDALLRAFGTGLVDLHTVAPAFQVTLTDRPTASPLARWQAVAGSSVTNGLHETVSLNDLQRQVLLGLDGTRNREELTQFVAQRVAEGYLILMAQTGRVETAEAAGAILREQVPQAVEFLARAALLVE